MVKVAIPLTGDLLSKNFGDCSHYVIYEIDNKEVINKKKVVPPKKRMGELSKWTEMAGITDVIVHGIDNSSVNYFSTTKINLFVGVTINEPECLIEEYLKGALQSDAQNILTPIIHKSLRFRKQGIDYLIFRVKIHKYQLAQK